MTDLRLKAGEPEKWDHNMARNDYDSIDAISQSQAKVWLESPRLYEAMFVTKELVREPSDDLTIGTIVHAVLLEGKAINSLCVAVPEGMRRDARQEKYRDFLAEANGREVLTAAQVAVIDAMCAAASKHELASRLLKKLVATEHAIQWKCEDTGIQRKALLDGIADIDGTPWVIDIKTTRDAMPAGFTREIEQRRYDVQAAWYQDAVASDMTSGELPPFVFIAISKDVPFRVRCYTLGVDEIQRGRDDARRALLGIAQARKTGNWSDDGEAAIVELKFPKWAFNERKELVEA